MNEKNINTRIQHKHDIEANWLKAINFIPKAGELIIYDRDSTHNYERIKIGNGETLVSALPFYADNIEGANNTYTATITTTWTGSAAPYSQEIAVNGITADDNPVVDLTLSGVYLNDQTRLAEWGKIYRIVTAANKITVYATEPTTAELPIQLQAVR